MSNENNSLEEFVTISLFFVVLWVFFISIANKIDETRCEHRYNVKDCVLVYVPNTETQLIEEYGSVFMTYTFEENKPNDTEEGV